VVSCMMAGGLCKKRKRKTHFDEVQKKILWPVIGHESGFTKEPLVRVMFFPVIFLYKEGNKHIFPYQRNRYCTVVGVGATESCPIYFFVSLHVYSLNLPPSTIAKHVTTPSGYSLGCWSCTLHLRSQKKR
jgi:hypothetical protein